MTPRSWLTNSTLILRCSLKRDEQPEDLLLHGDVERRRRFVGDEQLRVGGDRCRDHHSLLLTARELMRVATHQRRRVGQLDLLEQFDDLVGDGWPS